MPRPIPPPLSLALSYLRTARGWTQKELAQASARRGQTICDLEKGQRAKLLRESLDELAEVMGYLPGDVTLALLLLAGLSPGGRELHSSPVEPSPAELRRASRIAARVGLAEANRQRSHLLALARLRRAAAARRLAARQWEALRAIPLEKQLHHLETSPKLHHWALAEHLCAESARAAPDTADRALHLARLALRVAELAPGKPAWRSRLLGYAWGFVANAQRVGSDLPLAAASFATAWKLWQAGATCAAGSPLPEWRLLDLEASLRRDQRQFRAALDLLGRALASAPPSAQGRILLNRAATLEQAGRLRAAVTALKAAAPLVDSSGEPRDRLVVRFNGIALLCGLGRYAAAAAQLPELRRLAEVLGNQLDLLRVLWLTGRVAAGLRRSDEAIGIFGQVQRDFTDRRNGYDAALVSLELAILHLEAGATGQVRLLAEEMLWIFSDQQVHREALAALRLFCRAAVAESATTELARRLLAYLERARQNPRLRFAPAGEAQELNLGEEPLLARRATGPSRRKGSTP